MTRFAVHFPEQTVEVDVNTEDGDSIEWAAFEKLKFDKPEYLGD